MEITLKLLLALSENKKITFRNIQDKTKISPRIIRRYLDQLISRRLVNEEGRENWKHGKKLYYSLTEKGRRERQRLVANAVAEYSAISQKISENT